MGMNKVKEKGNMYGFVTHTWNPVKGQCSHGCGYCYMKSMAKRFNRPQPPTYLDEDELSTNLGKGNCIFVGSSNDIFASDIPDEWVEKTLARCEEYDNRYFFQSKNPGKMFRYIGGRESISGKSVVCTTIETNRHYREIMKNCPTPVVRAEWMRLFTAESIAVETFITIEPVIDFDLFKMVELVKLCQPKQVNIGADSGHNYLPEPSKGKVLALIAELESFTVVKQKSNLSRILK
jgi:DNA repair photolyase